MPRFVACTENLTNRPILLRSYTARNDENHPCYVWQAARATSGAQLFFKEFKLEYPGQNNLTLSDGSLHYNNPVSQVVTEAFRMDDSREIGCLISLGTGRMDKQSIGKQLHKVALNCVEIALNCHDEHTKFVGSRDGETLDAMQRYFRFDVDRMMGGIKLEDHTKLDDISAYVDAYLVDYRNKIKLCAERICWYARFVFN
jgi:hypothetical protein